MLDSRISTFFTTFSMNTAFCCPSTRYFCAKYFINVLYTQHFRPFLTQHFWLDFVMVFCVRFWHTLLYLCQAWANKRLACMRTKSIDLLGYFLAE